MSDLPLKIYLFAWNVDEGKARAKELIALGFDARFMDGDWRQDINLLRQQPPDAVIIDYTRLPSHGMETALAIRFYKTTRHLPIVIAGGVAEKIARLREKMPDAVYTPWEEAGAALHHAIANPPVAPVKSKSLFEAYSGQPLWKKLGIKANVTVCLLNPPEGFRESFTGLPEGVRWIEGLDQPCDVLLWFCPSKEDLNQTFSILAERGQFKALWAAWRKKGAGGDGISQVDVRRTGLDLGLVDYKICSIDKDWSGLCFTRRKKQG